MPYKDREKQLAAQRAAYVRKRATNGKSVRPYKRREDPVKRAKKKARPKPPPRPEITVVLTDEEILDALEGGMPRSMREKLARAYIRAHNWRV